MAKFSTTIIPPVNNALLFVHGSAADEDSWSIQRAFLGKQFRVVTYTRVWQGVDSYSVADHAADAARIIGEQDLAPAVAVGSSFGAVCVLELARRRPELLRGIVLCEPPLPPNDDGPLAPATYREELERRYREDGPRAAAELFLRRVLGDAGFEKMPARLQERTLGMAEQIRLDSDALNGYRVDYASLAQVTLPVLLLGGDRSGPLFEPTLAALAAALPNAERETLRGGSHMMHADAARQFNAVVAAFAQRV